MFAPIRQDHSPQPNAGPPKYLDRLLRRLNSRSLRLYNQHHLIHPTRRCHRLERTRRRQIKDYHTVIIFDLFELYRRCVGGLAFESVTVDVLPAA